MLAGIARHSRQPLLLRRLAVRPLPIAAPRRWLAADPSSSGTAADPSAADAKPAADDAKPPVDEKMAQLQQAVAAKDKKVAELQDAYLRAVAETENVRQRSEKELLKASQFGIQKFAKDLLDTADVLAMALSAVPKAHLEPGTAEHKVIANLYDGVDMTRRELLKTFARHGVEPFEHIGDDFDPNMHQALYQAPRPGTPAGKVIDCIKVGYMLKGRVLRPAHVGVSTESAEKAE